MSLGIEYLYVHSSSDINFKRGVNHREYSHIRVGTQKKPYRLKFTKIDRKPLQFY